MSTYRNAKPIDKDGEEFQRLWFCEGNVRKTVIDCVTVDRIEDKMARKKYKGQEWEDGIIGIIQGLQCLKLS